MKDFKENNCRLCKKVFCCENCRKSHETRQHNIFPGCEICIRGKTVISLTDENVINHIKICHWPLHCVICKRLFGSIEELFQHIKCPLANKLIESLEKSPYTPHQSNVDNAYTSPYFLEKKYNKNSKFKVTLNLATSTPMQRECNHLLEKINEVIVTPIDCLDTKENNFGGSSSSINLKRKVTFCDTPITESFSKKSKNMTSATQGESTYYTATEQIDETADRAIAKHFALTPCIKITDSPICEENCKLKESENLILKEEKTIWISAVNISAEISSNLPQELTPVDIYVPNNHFATPMVPKGRKINVVSPTKVTEKQEEGIQIDGNMQISSTPNSSTIPVKSAPNIRDIFRNTDQVPSTSKSNLENWGPLEHYSENCGYSDISQADTSSINASIPNKLWTSVSNIVRNVLQGFSNSMDIVNTTTLRPLKRHYSDHDVLESPMVKRYKVTDIKCRRNIRDMTPIHKYMEACRKTKSNQIHINIVNSLAKSTTKTYTDKATQTEEYLFMD